MTTFDERDKGFENKFAKDKELAFKINARRNKLLGLWAAGRLGKTGLAADFYAKDVVAAEFENNGDDQSNDVVEKILRDLKKAGLPLKAEEIRAEMERLYAIARKEIAGDAL
jgi:hypothetical protein